MASEVGISPDDVQRGRKMQIKNNKPARVFVAYLVQLFKNRVSAPRDRLTYAPSVGFFGFLFSHQKPAQLAKSPGTGALFR